MVLFKVQSPEFPVIFLCHISMRKDMKISHEITGFVNGIVTSMNGCMLLYYDEAGKRVLGFSMSVQDFTLHQY